MEQVGDEQQAVRVTEMPAGRVALSDQLYETYFDPAA